MTENTELVMATVQSVRVMEMEREMVHILGIERASMIRLQLESGKYPMHRDKVYSAEEPCCFWAHVCTLKDIALRVKCSVYLTVIASNLII